MRASTDSWAKAEQVWCSANRNEALTKAKLGQDLKAAKSCGDSPVARGTVRSAHGEIPLPGPAVLALADGSAVPGYVVRDWLEAAQRRAGLHVMGSLHKLRHTFCSHLAMRGAPPKAIQELAGHESLTTTLRYMHLSPSARDQAIDLLNNRHFYGNLTATEGGPSSN